MWVKCCPNEGSPEGDVVDTDSLASLEIHRIKDRGRDRVELRGYESLTLGTGYAAIARSDSVLALEWLRGDIATSTGQYYDTPTKLAAIEGQLARGEAVPADHHVAPPPVWSFSPFPLEEGTANAK